MEPALGIDLDIKSMVVGLLMRSGPPGPDLTNEDTIQDLASSLAGAAVGALTVATVRWPAPGTPATLFGWS
jgi:hypothetical protein